MFDARSRSVGETILAEAARLRCDLLVAGAYSRNRLRDIVVGGVTGHLMAHAELPVLLVH